MLSLSQMVRDNFMQYSIKALLAKGLMSSFGIPIVPPWANTVHELTGFTNAPSCLNAQNSSLPR